MSNPFGAPAATVASAFAAVSRARADAPFALAHGDRRLTYSQLDHAARHLAGGLRAAGVRRGDRVVVMAGNRPEHVVWLLATMRLGAIHTAVHPAWTSPEVGRVLASAEPRVVAVEGSKLETVRAATGCADPLIVDLDDPAACDALIGPEPVDDDHAEPDDACALWYTSGTSGRAKGVVWNHRNFLFNALAINHVAGIGPDDVGLRVSPMAHNGISSAVIGTMMRGAPVHIMERFQATKVVELIAAERVTWTNLVPSAAELLLQGAAEVGVTTLPSLRRVLVGAAPTPLSLLERLASFLPSAAIIHGYGATEGYIAVCRPEARSRVDGSVGEALPGVEVKVVDDHGVTVAPREPGRIVFRSPGAMQRYWRDPETTAAVVSTDGWVDVGDLGHMDEHGSIWVKGRIADVIYTGGYNVYASEVEAVFDRLPDVGAAAVIGVDDPVLGQRVVAFVEPMPGRMLDVDALHSACEASLARYKRPATITVLDALPRNTYGKLQKRALLMEDTR